MQGLLPPLCVSALPLYWKLFLTPISGLAGLPQHPIFQRLIDRLIDLAMVGLCCCTRAFSSCGEWGLCFLAVHEVLIAVASLVAEHGL